MGEWRSVPALNINGVNIIAGGSWLKIASVHDEEWLERALQDPEGCVQTLKKGKVRGWKPDIFVFAQRVPETTPKYSYPMEFGSIAAIRLTTFEEWWEKLPQVTRKNVRRSEKRGVEVKLRNLDDELIRDIVELTKDSPVRQGKRFTHFGKTFDETKKDQSTHLDRSDFICAYSGTELIGLLKLVYGGNCASILTFLPKTSEQDKRPANALIAKAVEICIAKEISYIIYGMFHYGKKRQDSLLEFKIRNGFEEILVPRYHVPLTTWGAFCLQCNLHRGIIGMLPDSVLRAALSMRANWYQFARFSGRCSSMAEQPNRTRQTGCSIPPAGSNFLEQPTT